MKAGAFSNGRIPGSVHLDWMETVNQEDHRFKSVDDIASIYGALGMDEDSEIVTYCHSGVRSAHTFFVLTQLLGYKNVKNYDGSWIEWTYHNLPVEVDSLAIQLNGEVLRNH
jgi:thiosulfate/3-mercaptopyruvate sulfurtransferase